MWFDKRAANLSLILPLSCCSPARVAAEAIEKQLRQLDGLEPIGKLVTSSDAEVKKKALFLVVNMSVYDKNREQFRRIPNLITILVPGLDSADENVLRMTIKALVNLSILCAYPAFCAVRCCSRRFFGHLRILLIIVDHLLLTH